LTATTVQPPGQRVDTAKKVNEMVLSATELPKTTRPIQRPTQVAQQPTEVLISTQQVLFDTAAAAGARPRKSGGRLVAAIRRMVALSSDESRPRPRHYPIEYGYIQNARMAREMERL
jgi:hypothetical protein